MLHVLCVFLCLATTSSAQNPSSTCIQTTNDEIPENIQTIKEITQYVSDEITCNRDIFIAAALQMLQNNSLVTERLYAEVIETGDTNTFIEQINSEEIYTERTILGMLILRFEHASRLLEFAARKIQENVEGTKIVNQIADQIQLLLKVGRTAFNNVFILINIKMLKFIKSRNLYAVAVAKLISCRSCVNTTPIIKEKLRNEENWRQSMLVDGTARLIEYEQVIFDALSSFNKE